MTTTNSGRIAPTWRAANALAIALLAAFCTMPSMGDGPIFDPGGLGGGGGGGGTVVPPGPWGACLVGCPREIETPEDEYFCGDACAALASVGYDCGALDLEGWLEEHAFLMCPEGAWPGCCTEGDELCLGEQVVCCAEAWCEYQAALCGCQNIDDFHPAPPGSTSCDLTEDGKVDCQDLNDLWSEVSLNDDCGITADHLLNIACCFLDKVSDHCGTVWTPDEDGGAQPGETACEDIRECVEAKIGRPLTPDELEQLMDCYGADPEDCGCCKETSQGSGVYYYNCDDDLVCDRNGDGTVDCDDLKQLLDDSKQGCNNGEELDDEEVLEIACVFVAECAPQDQEDCEAFLNVVIDCLEDELCRSLTKDEVEDLGECTPNCGPTDCCTPAGGWNCGDDFKCDRNCDGEVDCADIQAYIDESEANCNEGQPPYDRAEKLALVCEFLTECSDEDLCADLLECIEGTILQGEPALDATELAQLAACSGCEELCDPNDDEEQPKPGEGDEDCDGRTKTATGPGGTDVPYGDTTESATDLVVAAAGPGFSATREYTSDPDYVESCTNGAKWSHSSTRHVDDGGQGYAGTDLVLKGSALGAVTVDVSGTGPWPLPGSTSRYVTQATASVGEDTVDTWRVVDPGRLSTDYFDSAGQASQGIGNGNITLIEEYTDDTNHRDTVMTYDWRDRRESTVNPLPPHEWVEYDNLDRVTARGVFTAEPSAIDDPLNSGGDFRGQYVETGYSQRGLVYRQAIATNPRSASPTFLETHTWFDETGRPVGTWGPNGPARKTTHDGLGRPATVYLTDRRDDAAPGASGNFADVYDTSGHAAEVDGDVVLEQTDYRYILDEGLLDLVTVRRRAHEATTSETGALDGTGISANKVITSYSGTWYDAADRPIRQAEYGTAQALFQSGGTAPTIDQQSPPDADADDATVLVSETTYNSRGLVDMTTDPAEQVTKFFFDSMDRRILVVENYDQAMPVTFEWYQASSPPGSSNPPPRRWVLDSTSLDPAQPDVNRVTSFVFDGSGNVIRQAAYIHDGAGIDMQETAYVYGVQPDGTTTLYSNDLLGATWYPDSVGPGGLGGPPTAPRPTFYSYNHLGELIESTDENDTKHTFTLDDLGRVTLDVAEVNSSITAFQIDDSVNAIEREFDELGRVLRVKSYEDYGGGSQAVANAVKFDFNDLWQVTEVTQQPDGPIDGNSVSVTHTYDIEPISGGGNYSRLTDLGYPDGWTLDYGYGVSGSTNDRISRLLNLRDDSVNGYVFAQYDYVGMAIPAIVDYGKPDVQLTRFASEAGERTTGVYPGLDRYGRIIRQTWIDGDFDTHSTSSSVPNIPPIVDLAYTYDNASNRTGAFDARPGAQQPLSHLYAYDGLHRLQEATRGVWDHDLQTPAVTHALGSQDWSLDPLGNWTATKIETNGTSGFQSDEEETRDHNDATSGDNEVNQLYERTLSSDEGGDELALTYDFAGSLLAQELTDDGQGTTTSLVHTHDAWNRLVKVQFKDASGTLHPRAEYEYNGLNWRTVKRSDTDLTDGTHALDVQRLIYYSAGWQLLEERVDADYQSSPGINSQMDYIWGARYIDDIVAHRRDSDPASQNGYESTWFHLTDAQFSTVAIIDANANVKERVTYSAYGRARHHWYKDVDGDGGHDTTDRGIVQSLRGKSIDDAGYRAEADLDRDGDIDNADYTIVSSSIGGIGGQFGSPALPEGQLSSGAVGNQIGFCGYVFNAEEETYRVRWRPLIPVLGRWARRDPKGYRDGLNLYEYVASRPLTSVDPSGMAAGGTEFRHIAFIPFNFLMDPIDGDRAYAGDGGPNDWRYDRPSFRMRHTVTVALDDVPCDATADDLVTQTREVGLSIRYAWVGVIDDLTKPNVWINQREFEEEARGQEDPLKAMRVEVSGLTIGRKGGQCCVCSISVRMIGSGTNPVGPLMAPAIDYKDELQFTRGSCDKRGQWRLQGSHDGFPSHAFYMDRVLLHAYSAVGHSPCELFGDSDETWGPITVRR